MPCNGLQVLLELGDSAQAALLVAAMLLRATGSCSAPPPAARLTATSFGTLGLAAAAASSGSTGEEGANAGADRALSGDASFTLEGQRRPEVGAVDDAVTLACSRLQRGVLTSTIDLSAGLLVERGGALGASA